MIIEGDNKEKKVENKVNKDKNNPFVQRNQKKDYNIVYRNKPTKPMTVSELFGLNKEENKKQEDVEKKEKMKVEEKKIEQKETVVHKKNQNINRNSNDQERKKQPYNNDRGNYQPRNSKNNTERSFQNNRRDGFRTNSKNNSEGQNNFQRRDNRYQNNNGDRNWQRDSAVCSVKFINEIQVFFIGRY